MIFEQKNQNKTKYKMDPGQGSKNDVWLFLKISLSLNYYFLQNVKIYFVRKLLQFQYCKFGRIQNFQSHAKPITSLNFGSKFCQMTTIQRIKIKGYLWKILNIQIFYANFRLKLSCNMTKIKKLGKFWLPLGAL